MSAHSHPDGDVKATTIAETDNFLIWIAEAGDDETTYNIELGNVTLHLYREEWDEFLKLIRSVKKA
jgi:hypothetical protein